MWFAVHILIAFVPRTKGATSITAHENIHLVDARDADEASRIGNAIGLQANDRSGRTTVDGVACDVVFKGVRKVVEPQTQAIDSGDEEITYFDLRFASAEDLDRFVDGEEGIAPTFLD